TDNASAMAGWSSTIRTRDMRAAALPGKRRPGQIPPADEATAWARICPRYGGAQARFLSLQTFRVAMAGATRAPLRAGRNVAARPAIQSRRTPAATRPGSILGPLTRETR